jgi:two-component system, LuxR family, response regulator FixJ
MYSLQLSRDCIGLIEDDDAVRHGIGIMLETLNIDVMSYASATDFLKDAPARRRCKCLILDVRLPDMSGIELQKQLTMQHSVPAIVFISGHAEVSIVVECVRRGAIDFLQKPFKEQQLIDSVQIALTQARVSESNRFQLDATERKLASLTIRERDVLAGLVKGFRNKEIASQLKLSTRTIEEHRQNLMHKLQLTTIAELMNFCATVSKGQ